jgi:hypothetical protein
MRFFLTGSFWPQSPPEIKALPIDLLRSSAYPMQPGVTERGIEQYQAGYDPIMVPQRMGFTKWKDPGYPQAFGANVVGMLQATRHQMQVQAAANQKVSALPTQDYVQAAERRGLTRIPTQVLDPNLRAGYLPLAKGVIPMDQVVDADQLNRLSREMSNPASSEGEAKRQAMQSVHDAKASLAAIAGNPNLVPWFMR